MSDVESKTARRVKDHYEEELLGLPGVWGVGVGRLKRERRGNGAFGIRVLVHKLVESRRYKNPADVPSTLKDPETGAHVAVEVEAVPEGPSFLQTDYTKSHRPVQPAWSTGPEVFLTGTVGLIVKRARSAKPLWRRLIPPAAPFPLPWSAQPSWRLPVVPRRLHDHDRFALSCMHVYGGLNWNAAGEPIFQPGPFDQPPVNRIGILADFVPFQQGPNYVDCAIARLSDPRNVDPVIPEIGRPTSIADAAIDMPVQKTGRTTGHSIGDVYMTNVSFAISTGMGRGLFFRDMDLLRLPHWPGDSGSAVCVASEARGRASARRTGGVAVVGLLFAGVRGTVYAFSCSIRRVMDQLDIELA